MRVLLLIVAALCVSTNVLADTAVRARPPLLTGGDKAVFLRVWIPRGDLPLGCAWRGKKLPRLRVVCDGFELSFTELVCAQDPAWRASLAKTYGVACP